MVALLTHLHSDHIVDLFQLIISSWHQGRSSPQKIYGPQGTQAYVDRLMKLWKPELEQRIAHEQRSSSKALEVEVTEIKNGTKLKFGKLKIQAVEVLHQPVKHEVFIHDEMQVITGKRKAKTVENVSSYHTLDSVVGKVAEEAEVHCLMLTHFAPPRFDREKLLSTVCLDFRGPIVIGEDLMTFDLERNSLSWKRMTISLGAHD